MQNEIKHAEPKKPRDIELIIRFCSTITLDDIARQWPYLDSHLLELCHRWVGLDQMPSTLTTILPAQLLHPENATGPWSPSKEFILTLSKTALAHILQWCDPDAFDLIYRFMYEYGGNNNDVYIDAMQRLLVQNFAGLDFAISAVQNCYQQVLSSNALSVNLEPTNTSNSGYNGLWVLTNIQIRQLQAQISLVKFMRFFSMSFALHIRCADNNTLNVKADIAVFPAAWSILRLDGQFNSISALPNGEPSIGLDSSAFYDNYIGWIENGNIRLWYVSKKQKVPVTRSCRFYAWPTIVPRRVYRLMLDIQNHMHVNVNLEQSADVGATIDFETIVPAERRRIWDETGHESVLQIDASYERIGY
ncbi:Aste57867_3000 [Aphanomyces stellatus]|uniref:Aste57867_3000 protein n=1 Tax=Aphanomyces stellatus TaxID=120398 RepID=A0A485K8T5_9STRA|nr:hypothetical protein As57867_002991 [Aphanomyces stellatus]VFT80181.1 Aste57867_3000 [Aphanomyces stellatus]